MLPLDKVDLERRWLGYIVLLCKLWLLYLSLLQICTLQVRMPGFAHE